MVKRTKRNWLPEFHKRYFRLFAGTLLHYVDSRDETIRSRQDLTPDGVLEYTSQPLCFRLTSGGYKRLMIAENKEEMEEWIDAIQLELDRVYREANRGGGEM